MTIDQISIFVENKPGCLADVTKIMSDHQIDMRALSIAETPDFGILRAIVSDTEKTAQILKEAGYIYSITPVLAIAIADQPGSLHQVLEILKEYSINLEYVYAFVTRKEDEAYMILRVADNDKAYEVLSGRQVHVLTQEELNQL